jgi:hypothetical protein
MAKRLNGRSVEMTNRMNLIKVAFDQGYVAYLPVVDEGIDLILYREQPYDLKMVQLKSRWTIDRKYSDRNIWIAFPEGEATWYLAPHDEVVELAKTLGFAEGTQSWEKKGGYSRGTMTKELRDKMGKYLFPAQEPLAETA